MDVTTAFLKCVLEDEIYETTRRLHREGKEHVVLRLRKSFYGLKQAPRVWHKVFHGVILNSGFRQCVADRCVAERHKNVGENLL